MKSFVFRPDVAIADTAFYAYGKTFEELAVNSCKAVTEAMVDIKKVEAKEAVEFSKSADTLEELLYSVMEEIIYLKDAKQLAFSDFKGEMKSGSPPYSITVIAKGEKINRKKHDAHSDVKAVTYHDYYVEQTSDGYKASVILDV
jgi:SHS2 domain-containing protein